MAENKTPVTMKVKDFAEREVLLVEYKFDQSTDREGQIAGIPRGGRLKIRVKALNDGNPELLGWMLNPNDPRDVEVAFENTVDGKAMKSLKGTGCYCVHYKEYWGDGEEHYEEVTITKQDSCQVAGPWTDLCSKEQFKFITTDYGTVCMSKCYVAMHLRYGSVNLLGCRPNPAQVYELGNR